jgi:two-component system chemotaxis sensor kinase CheA
MKDPLIHLVRNCLDHGIETPEERTRRGKPPRATVTMSISARNGSNVEMLISDDGKGIDAGKVKAAAGKMRLLSAEQTETLGDREALAFIFQSGVSTSPIITDISGRGLGLAIVKEKVEKLNGTLSVETEAGRGQVSGSSCR